MCPKVAIRWDTGFGYVTAAMDVGAQTLSTRFKRKTPRQERTLIMPGQKFRFSDWKFSLSCCEVAEVFKMTFDAPNPHVPFRI
jgi:hypothetical protein